LLSHYRLQNTPEAKSAVDNIEELLNTMQEYTERTEADIRQGEREEFDRPTVEEWLQNVMLMTDMDNEDPESNNKVTLMTVHSAKGLEYKYVYIVGCEENLFPAMMSLESLDGLEEERRLFYVALTRAKTLATLTCADMRFRWGQMNFSTPSRFLTEIDSQYVESDFDLRGTRRNRELNIDQGEDAITTLRRRYDVRSQQKRSQNQPFRPQPQPKPQPQETPKPSYNTERMRRVESSASGATTTQPCAYTVGQRVNHPKFGNGTIVAIEALATDHKLKVDFGAFGEKTLLAKLAKLTVL
ncbi:MAG: ATP-binding domain-containing protein, partial [Alistipes sp.]|nr:ATP-binding domain-containing protein [Alistipes sp.]